MIDLSASQLRKSNQERLFNMLVKSLLLWNPIEDFKSQSSPIFYNQLYHLLLVNLLLYSFSHFYGYLLFLVIIFPLLVIIFSLLVIIFSLLIITFPFPVIAACFLLFYFFFSFTYFFCFLSYFFLISIFMLIATSHLFIAHCFSVFSGAALTDAAVT